MGKDATLVRYDAGTFGAGAGFGFCFPPILIGPVPVQICIGGSFRVEGRFAIGYDTSGLRKVLEGGTGTHLLDGIFIDDYDANGAEVPEVKFTGTVYAEGAVSVYIFKVGIRGEIIFTTDLDLHEDDPQDGKLRIEEIISQAQQPALPVRRAAARSRRRSRPSSRSTSSSRPSSSRSRSSGSPCSNSTSTSASRSHRSSPMSTRWPAIES